jgi:hypothetical protein
LKPRNNPGRASQSAAGGNDFINAGNLNDRVLSGPRDDMANGAVAQDFLALAQANDVRLGRGE